MFVLRLMQGWSIFLWVCLLFGAYAALRDHQYGPAIVGIFVNLVFQYSTRKGIHQRQERLNGPGDVRIIEREGRINRVVLRTAIPFLIALAVSVALTVSGLVTPQQEAFIVSALAIVVAIISTRSLRRVPREQRK